MLLDSFAEPLKSSSLANLAEPPLSAQEKPPLDAQLHWQLHQMQPHHYSRLLIFLALYGLAATIAYQSVIVFPSPWRWLLLLPSYLLAAASLHGISLFTHEAVHGVLSSNPLWNRVLGALCAFPVLQNCSAYRVLHLQHHHHLGLPGDPDHYKNYTGRRWLLMLMHWGRLLLGYPVYITAIPILGFRQGNRDDRLWIAAEVLVVVILAALIVASPIPRAFLWHGWLIPMLFINTMVNIRGMSQHTLLVAEADLIHGTRTIISNSITRFFMCNENYHLEHHLYPGVAWYNLPRLHAALKPELERRGAPYIDSYWVFVRDFVLASLRRSPVGTVTL